MKQDHIDFKCFNYHYLDKDVCRFQSYGIYKCIYSQTSRFSNVCPYDSGIKNRNTHSTAKTFINKATEVYLIS